MINKHEMKLIDQEITDLRNQVFYLNTILNNVTEWLEGERTLTLNPSEIADCYPNDDDVVIGRVECAECLLEQINKWEGEE